MSVSTIVVGEGGGVALESRQPIRVSRTGTLFVNAGPLSEAIRVHYRPNGRVVVDITYRGTDDAESRRSASFKRSDVKRLHIDAGAGDDVVQVDVADLTRASTIYGGVGDDQLATRGVNTQLFGESGDDTLTSDREVDFGLAELPEFRPIVVNAVPLTAITEPGLIDASYNALYGGIGDDVFRTYGGEDSLIGGSGDDVFEPMADAIERVELAADGALPGLTPVADRTREASRVGLRSVHLTERQFVSFGEVEVDYESLQARSFA